jgi:predicted hydrocarbon binding protein
MGNLGEAKHFAEFSEMRHASGPVSNRTLVVDRSGALIYVSGAEGLGASDSHEVALWSSAPAFQRLARDYHQRLWTKGAKSEERIVALETPPAAALPVVRGRESEPIDRLREVTALGMRIAGVDEMTLDLAELIGTIGRQLGRELGRSLEGEAPPEVARSLQAYYAAHAMGRLSVVKDRPLVLRVNDCFACVHHSPEVGRVLCPEMLRAALESRLGARFDVSKPDPRRHAQRGCLFTVTAG